MNKFLKKIAVVLSLAIVFAAMPMSVFAQTANTVEYNGTEYLTINAAVEAVKTAGDPAATLTVVGTVPLYAAEASSVDVDLNGVTIIGADSTAKVVFKNVDGNNVGGTGSFSNFIMKNVTVVDETFYTGENGENAWEFTYLEFAGTTVFENVNFTDGIFCEGDSATFTNCTFSGHNNDSSAHGNVTMYGAWVNNGTAKFTNCTFTGTRGLKVTEIYGNADVSTVAVEGTVFDNLSEKPGIVMDAVTSNGGSATGFEINANNNTFNDANGKGMFAVEGEDKVTLSGVDIDTAKADVLDGSERVYFGNKTAAENFAQTSNGTLTVYPEPAATETPATTCAHYWGYNPQYDAAAHWDYCHVCGAQNTPVA
ncbi:MAG: hypothetical protein J6C04_01850, partial [Oscillospiraceae bacterium]|nr:hypothetical protein [Oscillospiraceae bacterium]